MKTILFTFPTGGRRDSQFREAVRIGDNEADQRLINKIIKKHMLKNEDLHLSAGALATYLSSRFGESSRGDFDYVLKTAYTGLFMRISGKKYQNNELDSDSAEISFFVTPSIYLKMACTDADGSFSAHRLPKDYLSEMLDWVETHEFMPYWMSGLMRQVEADSGGRRSVDSFRDVFLLCGQMRHVDIPLAKNIYHWQKGLILRYAKTVGLPSVPMIGDRELDVSEWTEFDPYKNLINFICRCLLNIDRKAVLVQH